MGNGKGKRDRVRVRGKGTKELGFRRNYDMEKGREENTRGNGQRRRARWTGNINQLKGKWEKLNGKRRGD